jgi:phosphoribosyl 1,2-cyclic phosphodiesterase
VDAGLSCREIEKRLASIGISPGSIDAVLLSHEHQDHIKGAPRFVRRHRIPVLSTEGTYCTLKRHLNKNVDWLRVKSGESFKLDRLSVDVFPTPHDAREPVAFRFRRGKLGFSHVTDIGYISEPVEEGLQGSHVVLIESNHDVEMLRRGPYPESLKRRVGGRHGHLSNEALARYLESRLPESVRTLILGHLSETNNHESLALESARAALERRSSGSPNLIASRQDRPTRLLRLGMPRPISIDQAQGVLAF